MRQSFLSKATTAHDHKVQHTEEALLCDTTPETVNAPLYTIRRICKSDESTGNHSMEDPMSNTGSLHSYLVWSPDQFSQLKTFIRRMLLNAPKLWGNEKISSVCAMVCVSIKGFIAPHKQNPDWCTQNTPTNSFVPIRLAEWHSKCKDWSVSKKGTIRECNEDAKCVALHSNPYGTNVESKGQRVLRENLIRHSLRVMTAFSKPDPIYCSPFLD